MIPLPWQRWQKKCTENDLATAQPERSLRVYGRSHLGQIQWGHLDSGLMKRLHLMRGAVWMVPAMCSYRVWERTINHPWGSSCLRHAPSTPSLRSLARGNKRHFLMLICHIEANPQGQSNQCFPSNHSPSTLLQPARLINHYGKNITSPGYL